MSLDYSFPANWCFKPQEYQSCLFWPVSNNGGSEYGGFCYIYVYNGLAMWADDLYGIGIEDVVKLIPYYGRLYSLIEGGRYGDNLEEVLRVKLTLSCLWAKTFQMGPKSTRYGAFDGFVYKNNCLYVPISGYAPGTPIVLWRHDGGTWVPECNLFYAPGESIRAWAAASVGDDQFYGIAGRGRGISVNTALDGIWRRDIYGTLHHESAAKAQCFIVLPSGEILAGCTGGGLRARRGGSWDEIFNAGTATVGSLELIGGELWIGTELPGKVFRVPLTSWNFKQVSGDFGEVSYVSSHLGQPVVASYNAGTARIRTI